MTYKSEVFISVDVETSGPIPGEFSLLSIGACDVYDDTRSFSVELKPISANADPKALEVTGLSLETLAARGETPEAAMAAFGAWAHGLAGEGGSLVFVGFNAPFDWSFINYSFHRYAGANPFGFTALDIKALYMGATGCAWTDTRSSQIAKHLGPRSHGDHDALHDAKYQAELFRLVRAIGR
jgi:DNA polymerase III epsilon subunit-like protein